MNGIEAAERLVKLTVNGEPCELSIAPWTTLPDALREHLHLTGTKKGCDHGQCGSCTVLVDGARMNACLILAVMAEGLRIETIEGLAAGAVLHPVQAAFVEHDGYQCGSCTPGQIMSAAWTRSRRPKPRARACSPRRVSPATPTRRCSSRSGWTSSSAPCASPASWTGWRPAAS